MTYEGPLGMTAAPLAIDLTISGSNITGALGIGSTSGGATNAEAVAATTPLTGTRTGAYCKVTAAGAGGAVFTGTCTASSFSGTFTEGSKTGNFSLKASGAVPQQIATAPMPAPSPPRSTAPEPIPAYPPFVPTSTPPPCVNPVVAPPEASPGAPLTGAANSPQSTPAPVQRPSPSQSASSPPAPTATPAPVQRAASPPAPTATPGQQSVLYCGTFTNTTYHFTGYLEIRVDPGAPFSGEVSVGQAISKMSGSTYGSGTFAGTRNGTSCGATDSGGLQFTCTLTATSISSNHYSIGGQIGTFSVTTAGCPKKE
ncbi:MAG: hypothetical protein ABR956_18035 [Terracidiphilus sp.]